MSSYQVKKTSGETQWFRHDRFGMFIHFGLYALPARHEWIKTYEKISEEKYQKYFENFDPDLCDPRQWAKQAKAAGMKYAVLTTKHHEGFCLFDSAYTDYKSTNTPCGRDLVREYVEAFRAEGLKIGFYYSLLDWHHPDYRIDYIHPRALDADAQALDAGRDMAKYNQYMRDQVRELLTNYGKIDILWFDFSINSETQTHRAQSPVYPWMWNNSTKLAPQWEAEEMVAMIRSIQPDIVLNNRIGLDPDIFTPEQTQPTKWVADKETGELCTWEVCQTFSGAWGYHRDEATWKSPQMLIDMLVNTVACGGNLIMNVGPIGRGNFDYRAEAALDTYAQWMRFNARSIYGCTMAEPEFAAPAGTKLTQSEDGKRLYIHLQTYPFKTLSLGCPFEKIDYVQFLHDASEILYGPDKTEANAVALQLPVVKPPVISPVIEVILK